MKIGKVVWNNLGHCQKCARDAFLASCLAWIVAFGANFFSKSVLANILMISLAGSLSALWLIHLFVFAVKSSMPPKRNESTRNEENLQNPSRRAFFPAFSAAFTFGLLATAIPGIAYANKPCSCPNNQTKPCSTASGKTCRCCPNNTACGDNWGDCRLQ